MLKAEQIPDAVAKAFEEEYRFGEGDWKRNCLAAAINAWPGIKEEWREHVTFTSQYGERRLWLCIPLPKEASDE